MLEEDLTAIVWATTQENVNCWLTKEEIKEEEANAADTDSIAYIEALTPAFDNAFKWVVRSPKKAKVGSISTVS